MRNIGRTESREDIEQKKSELDSLEIKIEDKSESDGRYVGFQEPFNILNNGEFPTLNENFGEDVTEIDFAIIPSYDLEKAIKYAEITWAADPFKKAATLPGNPTFDIDFSKNPGKENSYQANPTKLHEVTPERRQTIETEVLARTPTVEGTKGISKKDDPAVDIPLLTFFNENEDISPSARQDVRRHDPTVVTLAAEDDKLDGAQQLTIEALTWTPALLRRKLENVQDPRQ